MGKLCLVTGGARSGKSSFAEKMARDINESVLYIATSIVFDEEMKDRVKKHRAQRPRNWDTFEGYKNLAPEVFKASKKHKGILLDCATIMMTNLLFDIVGTTFDDAADAANITEIITNERLAEIETRIIKEFETFIDAVKETSLTVIVVTNEIGFGVVPETVLGRVFRDIAGRVNQYIASRAEEVYLVVCGIEMKIK
ncbi:bifunctional adenosylcobinamide kinase/adenosylcobinamide-phosphate guanylyltransferase [Candidatus Clostridium stratigraminis]|uniref:Adenosylcobinamide kinase n=1 Tax=Candidatus Clostridium stratigraminis TaxID=3381661 RepID=A0ABW8T1L5_9CLOT